jgi:membrane-bound serine protease (ClpP class)
MTSFSPDSDTAVVLGFALLFAGLLLLAIELKYFTHFASGSLGMLLFFWSILILGRDRKILDPAMATGVALAFGVIAGFLGYLGMRARKTRHLTGQESLVGALGVAKTDINPDGTVMIRGEYWRAHGYASIPAGRPVSVESVQDLMLFVREV